MSLKDKKATYSELENRIKELEAINDNSRAVYDHASFGIEIFNHDGLLIDANKKIFEMFGVKPEEVINKFNLKDDPNYQYPEIWKKLNNGIEVSNNIIFSYDKAPYNSSKKGIRHYSVTTTPFKEYSKKIGYLVQVVDITEQRKNMINDLTSMITNALSNNNSKLLEFINHIDSSTAYASLNSEFSTLAKEVRNEFTSLVLTRFPYITPNELKVIELLHLNLTTKQIAHTLGRSTRTIENTRFNIRKKLDIESKISLSSFIKSIS